MSLKTAWSAFAHRGARRAQVLQFLLYSAMAVLLVVLLSAWIVDQVREAAAADAAGAQMLYPRSAATPWPWSVFALADVFCVFLLGLGLFLVVPAAVAATISGERRAGTLDQLRTTPLRPLALLVGLVAGAPSRIYLLCAAPLGLHLVAGMAGVIPLDTAITSSAVLLVGGAASALLAAAVALAPRQDAGGALLALGTTALLGIAAFVTMMFATERGTVNWAFLHPAGALNATMLAHDGLWRRLMTSEWSLDKFHDPRLTAPLGFAPLASSLFLLAMGGLLARGACRKLESPHAPLFDKPFAVATFSLIATALWLPAPLDSLSRGDACVIPFVMAIFLTPVIATLGVLATPSAEAWALAVRLRPRTRPWQDHAAPHATVWAMLILHLAIACMLLSPHGFPTHIRAHEALALLWLVFGVATLPIFMLFAATRYQTAGARWAFGCAVVAYGILQVIGIALVYGDRLDRAAVSATVCKLAAATGLVVPALVLWRQRALTARTRLSRA